MTFSEPLIPAILLKRYQRFKADVRLRDGSEITVHCPNSGSMKTCKTPGWQVLLSDSKNPARKLRYTWEMVHNGRCWIGINTHLANKIVAEAIENQAIPELRGYTRLQSEQKYGVNSRIDILLSTGDKQCYVEVKNVTLVEDDGYYQFPDAVTSRGKKHLDELAQMVRQGHRAVMFFLVQRSDGKGFRTARHIDPDYAQRLTEVRKQGVEVCVYRTDNSPRSITIAQKVETAFDE